MTKPGRLNGGEGPDVAGTSRPSIAEMIAALVPRTHEGALLASCALTVLSFLLHIVFLLLVDPFKIIDISKDTAFVYSGIPLCFGAVFLCISIFSFIKIERRSVFHIVLLLASLSLGSMSIQGILGIALRYVNQALMTW